MGEGLVKMETKKKSGDMLPGSGEELYRSFLAGNSSAFEDLVAMYEDELSRFIYGIVCDYHETEHLTIDTFTQLALNKKPFKGDSTLKTYLFGIAKNLTLQHMKKRKRDQHISFEDVAELDLGNNESIQDILEKEEATSGLREAMRELKKEYHAVLILLYFENMSYRQAGQVMNKSEKQIKNPI